MVESRNKHYSEESKMAMPVVASGEVQFGECCYCLNEIVGEVKMCPICSCLLDEKCLSLCLKRGKYYCPSCRQPSRNFVRVK